MVLTRQFERLPDYFQFLVSSLVACDQLCELHVANIDYSQLPLFNLDWSNIKVLRLFKCTANLELPLPDLPHLEELAIQGGSGLDRLIASSRKLHTLILDRTDIDEQMLEETLSANQSTLRNLTLAHITYNPYKFFSFDLYFKRFSHVPENVTNLIICHRMLRYIRPGNYKQLEIDAPLNDEMFLYLIPNFPLLERLTVNDVQLNDPAWPNYVVQLLNIVTLTELHIVGEQPLSKTKMRAFGRKVTPFEVNGRHLHLFVYSRCEIGCRRWMSRRACRGLQADCRWRTHKASRCYERHLIDSLKSPFICTKRGIALAHALY